jgi:alkaline phosphatase D
MWTILAILLGTQILPEGSHQATGVRVGEVTPDSAVVWMRLTAHTTRNRDGIVRKGRVGPPLPANVRTEQLEGACPGAPGRVRLRYGTSPDLRDAKATPWVEVTAGRDYSHQFVLRGLKPDTIYYYSAETAGPGGSPVHTPLRGQFRTAPPPDRYADVLFTVVTCHMYQHLDHPDGFHIYEAMAGMNPRFHVLTGDNVYYDNEDPPAVTVALARYHWERMWSLPRHVAFLLRFPAYWEKDDHDTLCDDCYPTKDCRMSPMTFADGQRIFLQQVPMGVQDVPALPLGQGSGNLANGRS